MKRRDKGLSGEEVAGIGAGAAFNGTNYAENVLFRGERGHGFAAEAANHRYDKLTGKRAKIVGRDNARNGPDRIVDGVHIQSKYCSSGAKCVAECFEDGTFRYFNTDHSPMQIEVPSDMYEGALKAMEARIEKGQVDGVSDTAKAKEIIRKGHFTYAQAKNVARFGTIESLTYDTVNGVKLAGQAMGISAALSFALSMWRGEELGAALRRACETGVKVGGVAWISSIVAAQLGRTGFENALRSATDMIVKQLGPEAAACLANGLRSGTSIYGAAAMNHCSKLLRGNLATGIATTTILSAVDFIRMFNGRMSGAQVFKNTAVTASGVACGTAGWLGGAAAGAAVGSVVPGLGTVIGGFAGGLFGAVGMGLAADKTAKFVLDKFIEDDAKQMLAIMEQTFGDLCVEYLLTEEEARTVLEDLQGFDLADTLRDMYASDDQVAHARRVLEPLVQERTKARKQVTLPSGGDMSRETRLILREMEGYAVRYTTKFHTRPCPSEATLDLVERRHPDPAGFDRVGVPLRNDDKQPVQIQYLGGRPVAAREPGAR